jgi:hypothetical protein
MRRLVSLSDTSDTNLREMFVRARIAPRLPDDVRARARARALAYLLAPPAPPPSIATRHIRSVRLAFAFSPAFAAAATGVAMGGAARPQKLRSDSGRTR